MDLARTEGTDIATPRYDYLGEWEMKRMRSDLARAEGPEIAAPRDGL